MKTWHIALAAAAAYLLYTRGANAGGKTSTKPAPDASISVNPIVAPDLFKHQVNPLLSPPHFDRNPFSEETDGPPRDLLSNPFGNTPGVM